MLLCIHLQSGHRQQGHVPDPLRVPRVFVVSSFSQSIGRWNTSQVCDISSFNQSIGGWNTSQIRGVWLMFAEDSSFYQALAVGAHHFSLT